MKFASLSGGVPPVGARQRAAADRLVRRHIGRIPSDQLSDVTAGTLIVPGAVSVPGPGTQTFLPPEY